MPQKISLVDFMVPAIADLPKKGLSGQKWKLLRDNKLDDRKCAEGVNICAIFVFLRSLKYTKSKTQGYVCVCVCVCLPVVSR